MANRQTLKRKGGITINVRYDPMAKLTYKFQTTIIIINDASERRCVIFRD